MRGIVASLVMVLLVGGMWTAASGYEINGGVVGSTAAQTPIAVGTSTPVLVVACASTRGVSHTVGFTLYQATGATCYVEPAAVASPCASPSPAPSAAGVGFPIPSGLIVNEPYQQFGGPAIMDSSWWMVCATAGNVSEEAYP